MQKRRKEGASGGGLVFFFVFFSATLADFCELALQSVGRFDGLLASLACLPSTEQTKQASKQAASKSRKRKKKKKEREERKTRPTFFDRTAFAQLLPVRSNTEPRKRLFCTHRPTEQREVAVRTYVRIVMLVRSFVRSFVPADSRGKSNLASSSLLHRVRRAS